MQFVMGDIFLRVYSLSFYKLFFLLVTLNPNSLDAAGLKLCWTIMHTLLLFCVAKPS